MEVKDDVSWGISRRPAILLGLAVAALSAVLAAYVGSFRADLKKQAVLEECQSSANAWLEGTVAATGHWLNELRKQRIRISGAETYRLFAEDLFGLDDAVAAKINESTDDGAQNRFDGAAAMLAEEVPHIRRMLKEYMDLSGYADARIINAAGHTLLSAQSQPAALSHAQREAAARVLKSGKPLMLPVRACSGGLMLDAFEPMFGLNDPTRVVAAFMVSRLVLADFTQFSARPKPEELAVAVFLQHNTRVDAAGNASAVWETVGAPLPKAVSRPLFEALAKAKGALPLAQRDSFYGHGAVYSSSQAVNGGTGAVALEIPASVVEHRMFRAALPVYIATFFGWLTFLLLCQLLWWVGVGKHRKAMTLELQKLHQTVSRQKELLDSVNISLDEGVVMVDVKGTIHVCNRAFAAIVSYTEEAVKGQPLFSFLPTQAASELLDRVRQTAISAEQDSCELWLEKNGEERLFRVSLFPFLDAGERNLRESMRGAVITMKDITEFRRRAERQRRQQRKLIEALSSAEASADPYLHGFSTKMADLSEKLAASMGLDEDRRNTLVMGAQLSQLGKLFVPRELLTKQGALTPEELAEVRRAPEHAARVLESVDFDLPIARTLYEMYENMDGSGYPRGISGEAILFEARLLGVLNAYCAMVSDRSYRQGMSRKDALDQLRSSPKFDQALVAELEKVVDSED